MKKTTLLENTIRMASLPTRHEQFAVVVEMSGGSRMTALCEDGQVRMIRIGGRFKKRMWCRQHDLILIKPGVVQADKKADLVYRYLPTERKWILSRDILPEELNIWQT